MASPLYTAQEGTYEEFLEVFDPDADDATDMLFAGLTNKNPDTRAAICNDMLDRGGDASFVEDSQNALTVLLGSHRHLGSGDAALAQRLVDGGADVNYRERRGSLVAQLAVEIRVDDDEQRRPLYEALFGSGELDLDLPYNVHDPVMSIGEWMRMNTDHRLEKHYVLDEFLRSRSY